MKKQNSLMGAFAILLVGLFLITSCGGGASSGASSGGGGGDSSSDDGGSDGSSGGGVDTPISSVTFDFSGAIGLAIVDSSSSSSLVAGLSTGSSNLKKVKSDNTLSNAIASGSATVQSFMVAANNQVYLLLSEAVDDCILVRVDGDTNEATCVDSSLSQINWSNAFGDPIQFDGEGNIYYQGISEDASGENTVLRENIAGTTETDDLINDNISLQGFLVLNDGTVFVAGSTNSTGASWTRIITPAHSLSSFLSGEVYWMSIFPDNNVYFKPLDNSGVSRYLTATGETDRKRLPNRIWRLTA